MVKRALVVGIDDYPGTGADLAGCVNDANAWTTALAARGFEVTRVVNATDQMPQLTANWSQRRRRAL